MERISVQDADALLEQDVVLIDVRTPREFARGCVPGSINVPLLIEDDTGKLTNNLDFDSVVVAGFEKDQPLILGCDSGHRSKIAGERLERVGFRILKELWCGFRGADGDDSATGAVWAAQGRTLETDLDTEEDRTYTGLVKMLQRWRDEFEADNDSPSLLA